MMSERQPTKENGPTSLATGNNMQNTYSSYMFGKSAKLESRQQIPGSPDSAVSGMSYESESDDNEVPSSAKSHVSAPSPTLDCINDTSLKFALGNKILCPLQDNWVQLELEENFKRLKFRSYKSIELE